MIGLQVIDFLVSNQLLTGPHSSTFVCKYNIGEENDFFPVKSKFLYFSDFYSL